MSSTKETDQVQPAFRVLDPNLPFLASEVAIDLDNMLLQTADDREAMKSLASKLLSSIEEDSAGGLSHNRMDMATLSVLGEAISEIMHNKNNNLKKVEDLLTKAVEIAKLLLSEDLKSKKEKLLEARDFCVALSRAVTAYSESIRDIRPSNPFRR